LEVVVVLFGPAGIGPTVLDFKQQSDLGLESELERGFLAIFA